MRIAVIPDKFKGSLTADTVAETICEAITESLPGAQTTKRAMADGGDGTMELIVRQLNGESIPCTACDALGRAIKTRYCIVPPAEAIIELAETIGLTKIEPQYRNPEKCSSFGFGIAIRAAIEAGHRDFLLGIGGSATNDCGTGLLTALGAVFYDTQGAIGFPTGADLANIVDMDLSELNRIIDHCRFKVACDVENPLYGPNGAAFVYAPQKGADPEMVERLDTGLRCFAELVEQKLHKKMAGIVGGGAAGGIGAGLKTFLNAELLPGTEVVGRILGIEEMICRADLVITAEGRFDRQSLQGKVAGRIGKTAARQGVAAVVFCGSAEEGFTVQELKASGIDAVIPIMNGTISLEESIANARFLLKERVKEYIKNYLSW